MPMQRANGCESDDELVPVYILAGGRSRRFGRDKARALVAGRPAILRIADTLSSLASRITVVARRPGDYGDLGLRTIGDTLPDKGPLGALLTALLDHRDAGWILVSACDWVGLRSEWLLELRRHVRTDAGAVVFRSDRCEPLLGLYNTVIRDDIEHMLSRNVLAMHKLLGAIKTVTVPAPFDATELVNWNEPAQRLPSDVR